MQQTTSADDIFRCIFFLGALRVKASGIPIPFIAVSFTNIEVIRQNVFSHARVMVIGVSSDLKCHQLSEFFSFMTIVGILTFMSM